MVPAGGRAKVTYLFSPPRRTIRSTPAWYPATYQLRGRQPRRWATRLSRLAADNDRAEYVVFCGVHFMAESADILTADHQKVVLPDLNAGCSMADMADLDSVEEAWEALEAVIDVERLVPITYMNSSAA